MAISKQDFSATLNSIKFRELFNEMGWNNDKTKQPIIVDDIHLHFMQEREKRF
jgi:hypothetical protein